MTPHTRRPKLQTRSLRPRLEALEDRTLLSVCTVDRLTDVGEGKELMGDLRYCITQAQDGDSIRFAVAGTLSLTRELPALTQSINIEGPGANMLTVRRVTVNRFRIFKIDQSAHVSIFGLTIQYGEVESEGGGGILNRGTLALTRSTVAGNGVVGDGVLGGGILNEGTMSIDSCAIVNNGAGGDSIEGAGIFSGGPLTIRNSTVSGNFLWVGGPSTQGYGAGIRADGRTSIFNSTVAHNRIESAGGSAGGGGILSFGGPLTIGSTIVARNDYDDFSANSFTSLGFNVIGSYNGSGFHPTDLLNVNPLLGPLQDNGGPTQTHALLPGSPAIDRGDASVDLAGWDQRGPGYERTVNGRMDIGAFEVQGGGAPRPGTLPGFAVTVIQLTQTAASPIKTPNSSPASVSVRREESGVDRLFATYSADLETTPVLLRQHGCGKVGLWVLDVLNHEGGLLA